MGRDRRADRPGVRRHATGRNRLLGPCSAPVTCAGMDRLEGFQDVAVRSVARLVEKPRRRENGQQPNGRKRRRAAVRGPPVSASRERVRGKNPVFVSGCSGEMWSEGLGRVCERNRPTAIGAELCVDRRQFVGPYCTERALAIRTRLVAPHGRRPPATRSGFGRLYDRLTRGCLLRFHPGVGKGNTYRKILFKYID